MSKKIIKDFVNVFIAAVIFATATLNNAFAAADYADEQIYKVRQQSDYTIRFSTKMPGLRLLPWDENFMNGDLSIELGNAFCIAYIALYSAVMYAGNAAVKAAATAVLLDAAAIIYLIATVKFDDFEICGADWLVWGSDDEASASALSDIRYHYPKKGAFAGSKKYDAIQCTKNFSYCAKKCENNKLCDTQYKNDIHEFYKKHPGSRFDPEYGEGKEIYDKYLFCLETNKCLIDYNFIKKQGRKNLNINDKLFRERLYDGEEIANTDCFDPREEAKKYDVNQERVAKGKKPYQLYYMRGYDPGNYACDRFLIEKQADGDEFDEAYKCCVKASDSICINDKMSAAGELRKPRAKFCPTGTTLCTFNEFIFEVFPSKDGDPAKYCAKTWSLCPYNFNIQKGSEQTMSFEKKLKTVKEKQNVDETCTSNCEQIEVEKTKVEDECYDEINDEALQCEGQIKNFYQYNRHCTIVDKWIPKYQDDENAYPPFIDKACMNFVGSSHNTEGYLTYRGYEKMFSTYKSFTAPVAECLSETLKNFLFNRAGHTKCLGDSTNPKEIPDFYGKCKTGYSYMEGEDLAYAKNMLSPAVKLLHYIHNLIMLCVTLMIVLYGYNILVKSGQLDRKDMMIMMLKVVIVITFSSGSWWYDQLFRFTYAFSNTFSALTSKIGFDETMDIEGNYIKYDGCYFGDINAVLGKTNVDSAPNIEENNYYLYPADRKYVAFFDSLDCKVTKYLGYSIGASVPHLIIFLAATFIWPFNIGIFLGVGTLMLALFVINFAIKAVYIFIASAIAMAVMLYVAPLIIPCILFKRTEGIFKKWLKNLISFALQPMVMFAFVSMGLTIMDKYILGSGIYTGSGVNRELICGYACVNNVKGLVVDYTSERGPIKKREFTETCGAENDVVDLKRGSVLCFLDKMTTSPWSALHSIGLFLPTIVDIFLSDVVMFLRVAFLFFILTQVLGTIPGIASNLTGGKDLPGTTRGDPFAAAKKLADLFGTLQRGVKSAGHKFADKIVRRATRTKEVTTEVEGKDGDKKDEGPSGDVSNVSARPTGGDSKSE